MDYRKAHSTSRLIDPRLVKQRDDYRNLGAIESARSNISYQMSEEDLRKQAIKQVPYRDTKGISELAQIQLILTYKISCIRASLEIPLLSLTMIMLL